jgi:hypothetical protein
LGFLGEPRVGTVVDRIDSGTLDGKPIWQCTSRVFLAEKGVQGLSTLVVEKESFIPLRRRELPNGSGEVEAVYSAKTVELKDRHGITSRTIPVPEPIYTDDELPGLLRRLPLAVDYKTSLPIFSTIANRLFPLGGPPGPLPAVVLGTKTIEVPAGKFGCFDVLVRDLGHHYHFSTDEHRYPVRLDTEGTSAELVRIGSAVQAKPTLLETKAFSLPLPSGWVAWTELPVKPDELSPTYLLNTDNIVTTKIVSQERGLGKGPQSLDALFETQSAAGKKDEKDFQVREGSRKQFQVDGQPTESYVADFVHVKKSTENCTPMARYVVNILAVSWAVSFETDCEAGQLDGYRTQLDRAIAELKWNR